MRIFYCFRRNCKIYPRCAVNHAFGLCHCVAVSQSTVNILTISHCESDIADAVVIEPRELGLGLLKSMLNAEHFLCRLSWSISSHFVTIHS